MRILFAYFYFFLHLIIFLSSANPCKVWVPFIYVFISTSYYLPHPTPEGSWWFLNHYQRVPTTTTNKRWFGEHEKTTSPPGKWLQFNVKPKPGACTQLGNLLANTEKKLDVMKHIHLKSQGTAQGGICQSTASSSPLLKMTVSAFNSFQQLLSLPVNSYFSLPTCPAQALPTFHCKVKELLVLCEGLGGKGHSGAELWVVKLTGSEQDPFTELYIAYTLEAILKRVMNLLTTMKWDSTASAMTSDYQSSHDTTHDRLLTDLWLSLLHFDTSMQKNSQ